MGTPALPDWPELELDKFYRCYVDSYFDDGPETDCSQDYVDRFVCCRTGQDINDWFDHGLWCCNGLEFCFGIGLSAQRLVACHGPYEHHAQCIADI